MITSTATRRHRECINVSQPERIASVLGGGALIARGIGKRSWGGVAMAALGGLFMYRGATGHCDFYQALGVNTSLRRRGRNTSVPYELGIRVDHAVTINKPAEEVYRFFRNLENLPRFMKHLESVREIDNKHSHWEAKGPAGRTVEWDAEIINEVENQLIAWRSLADAQVDNAGSVHFTPSIDGCSTEVSVHLQYNPPGGMVGAMFARLFGEEPSQQIAEDMRRLKQLLETGEIPSSESHPHGQHGAIVKAYHDEKRRSTKKGGWQRDWVQEASEESFPASDAPSWTPESLAN